MATLLIRLCYKRLRFSRPERERWSCWLRRRKLPFVKWPRGEKMLVASRSREEPLTKSLQENRNLSYGHKELNSSNDYMSLEEDPEPQKGMQAS